MENENIKCFGYKDEFGKISLIIKPLIQNILALIEISKKNKTIIEKIDDFIIYYCNINNYKNKSLDNTNGNLNLDLNYIGNFKKINNDLFSNTKKFKKLNRYIYKQNFHNILDNIYFKLIERKISINFIDYDYNLYEINEGINIYILISNLKNNVENTKNYKMIYIFLKNKIFYYLSRFIDI